MILDPSIRDTFILCALDDEGLDACFQDGSMFSTTQSHEARAYAEELLKYHGEPVVYLVCKLVVTERIEKDTDTLRQNVLDLVMELDRLDVSAGHKGRLMELKDIIKGKLK